MPRTTEKPTVTVGNGQPIALMSAAYCDEMRMRRPQCPQCGRQWYRIPAGQRAECACGYFGLQECTGDYYVEPCFIEFAWQVYERDFAPLIAPMHLVSDLVCLTIHMLKQGNSWTDICDGCKFSSHELESLSRAVPRDYIKLHFSAGQIYWSNDRRTVNINPRKFACEGSPQ